MGTPNNSLFIGYLDSYASSDLLIEISLSHKASSNPVKNALESLITRTNQQVYNLECPFLQRTARPAKIRTLTGSKDIKRPHWIHA